MPFLTEDVRQLLNDNAAKFLADNYSFENRSALLQSGQPGAPENWQQFAELGWLAIPFAENVGGSGGDVVDTLGLLRLFGKALVLEPFVSSIGLAGQAVQASTNEVLKADILPLLAAGKATASLAYEEQHSRGNPAYVNTTAVKTAGGYRLQGVKVVVAGAAQASHIVVSARVEGQVADTQGIAVFLVDTGSDGISLTPFPTVDGLQAANVRLDLQVPAERLLADTGQGLALLQYAINQGLLMLAAEAAGIMQALVELSVDYLNTRKQFAVPLATFQVLRHRLVDMYIAWQGSEHLLARIEADIRGERADMPLAVSLLKARVGAAARYVGQQAIQLHGGVGMTDELNIGHYVKRLLVIEMSLGNADWHLQQVWQQTA